MMLSRTAALHRLERRCRLRLRRACYRALDWFEEYVASHDAAFFIACMARSQPVSLDAVARWHEYNAVVMPYDRWLAWRRAQS